MRLTNEFATLTEEIRPRIGIHSTPEDVRLGLALAVRREALAWFQTLPASGSRDQLLKTIRGADRRLADMIAQNAGGIRDLAKLEFEKLAGRMDEFADDLEDHPGEELDDLLDTRRIACELAILLETLGEDRGPLDRRLTSIDAQLRKCAPLIYRMVFDERPRWIGDIPGEYWWLILAKSSGPE